MYSKFSCEKISVCLPTYIFLYNTYYYNNSTCSSDTKPCSMYLITFFSFYNSNNDDLQGDSSSVFIPHFISLNNAFVPFLLQIVTQTIFLKTLYTLMVVLHKIQNKSNSYSHLLCSENVYK